MDVIVCVKRVPDTGVRIEIGEGGLAIKEEGLPWVLNPYDEYAVEEAIRIKERFGGKVTLVTVGVEGVEEILKRGIAMGADEGIYIRTSNSLNGLDIARVLSKTASRLAYDLILCGKQGTDMDSGLIGGAMARLLNIPFISAIKRLEISQDMKEAEVSREVEGGVEVVACPLPALFTAQKGLNEPRYPSLPGIMRAKKKGLIYMDLEGIRIKETSWRLRRESLAYPEMKRKGMIFKGEIGDSVKALVRSLNEEAKVI